MQNSVQITSKRCLSHVFGFLLILLIVVIIFILFLLLCICFGIILLFLLIVFLFLSLLLYLAECLPLRGEGIGLRLDVTDDDVVKNCAALHLPQIKTNKAEVCVFVHTVIVLILRIVYLLGFPH